MQNPITTGSAGSTQPATSRTNLKKPSLPRTWTLALFARLEAIYPTQYRTVFPNGEATENAMREWAEAIADLTGPQIKTALEHCRANVPRFPSIAEFRMASGWHKPVEYYQAETRPPIEPVKAAKISAMLKQAVGSAGRRALPHGDPEYEDALKAARLEGRPLYDVDMAFMGRYGWTEAGEQGWRQNCRVLGWSLIQMYPKGHEPQESRHD